ncbi:hypothetical protein EGR_10076 [Echinococcus granulosus]|uniref:Uncharacterized protein n=1 Tax=Echinococcus granulosus TaxID=6210 RepID=W6U1S5_ECHGR|nr:hypothetical protein EGR_10076 [Echinococcus granulosus]EUB55055.1 hypothetical protein EGR_10076 [Echinococcus granulosus]
MRRFGFDLYSASMNLIQASPLIALVTFGIPLACLSCLVYCICCSHLDALDDAEGDLAAVGEARRARLLDREFVEAQLTSATYEDTIRARSIYSRFAGVFQEHRFVINRRGDRKNSPFTIRPIGIEAECCGITKRSVKSNQLHPPSHTRIPCYFDQSVAEIGIPDCFQIVSWIPA